MRYEGAERRTQVIQCENRMKNIEDEVHKVDKKIDKVDDKLDMLLKILLGNGKMGICSKVQVLWAGSIFILITLIGIIVKLVT